MEPVSLAARVFELLPFEAVRHGTLSNGNGFIAMPTTWCQSTSHTSAWSRPGNRVIVPTFGTRTAVNDDGIQSVHMTAERKDRRKGDRVEYLLP